LPSCWKPVCRRRAERGARRQGSGGCADRSAGSKALSFVGSTPIAEYIYAEGTKRGKRVQAWAARRTTVLMPDADLDNAVSALMGAAYGSCGERCMAISVAVCVGDQVADALVAKLEPQIKALKIGAGTSCGLDMGPLVTAAARDKVSGYIDDGVAAGAKLVVMAVACGVAAMKRLLPWRLPVRQRDPADAHL
jgi:acyl-CoA reductase-like NAD-dependent aldehyde dehydrogenase